MRTVSKLAAIGLLAGSVALVPGERAEARGWRGGHGFALGIAGAVIGSALLAGSYGYGHRRYYRDSYYYDRPSYVYGSTYYAPRWRHRHWRHHHRHW